MPSKPTVREPDRGLRYLEDKLALYVSGPGATGRRNPALDLLTGRTPDTRLSGPSAVAPPGPSAAPPVAAPPGPSAALSAAAPPGQSAAAFVAAPPGSPAAAFVAAPPAPGAFVAPVRPSAVLPPSAHPATLVLPRVISRTAPTYQPLPTPTRHSTSPWLAPAPVDTIAPRVRLVTPPGAGRRTLASLLPRALALTVTAGAALALGMSVRGLVVDRTPAAPVEVVAPVVLTAAPTAVALATTPPATAVPPTAVPTALPTLPARPTQPPAPTTADQFRVLADERFSAPQLAWPSNPQGTAWLADGLFHLATREPGKFVAMGIPGAADLTDVVLSATFRKLDGPSGGGYGLVVRDHPAPGTSRDGLSQDGKFYVFEVGDRGELGVWLRDSGRWVDLLPWTASDVVKPETGVNELTVSAIGETLSFQVNGIPVASQRDSVLMQHGGAALFAGGDGNEVVVERVTVRVPR